MLILIVAATEMEVTPFMKEFPNAEILITGVGTFNTVYELIKKIHSKAYDLIIQLGIAGSYKAQLNLGEAYLVKEDCFADLGVFEKGNFQTIFEMGFSNQNDFPFVNGKLENPYIQSFDIKVYEAKGATVNLLTDDSAYCDVLIEKYKADLESMEGAAFHYVCLKEKQVFLQIRGVSNLVGDRNKSHWKIHEAIRASNQIVIDIYKKYLKK